jgi:hypothetical protein
MKKITLTLVTITLGLSTFAQVGIGNNFPDSISILDLTNANEKGLILPRVAGSLPTRTDDAVEGMLFFKQTDAVIYYNTGAGKYNALSPWKYKFNNEASDNVYYDNAGNVSIGYPVGTALNHKLEVDGSVNVTGKIKEWGDDLVPSGVIVMWNGYNVPAGWALCNGKFYDPATGNSNRTNTTLYSVRTPDLIGRFILGSNGSAITGGQNTVTLAANNLPRHTHGMSHNHAITDPGHKHDYIDEIREVNGSKNAEEGSDIHAVRSHAGDYPKETKSKKTGISLGVSRLDTDNNITPNTEFDNRPVFYTLAYIMKL